MRIPWSAAALLLIFVFACGASARETTLRAALVSANVASDTFLAVSAKREKQIVDDCNPPTCTKEEGHARLEAFRTVTQPIDAAITSAYRALSIAALGSGAESVSEATRAVAEAATLVKELAK